MTSFFAAKNSGRVVMTLPFYFIQIDKFLLVTANKSTLSKVQISNKYLQEIGTPKITDIVNNSVYINSENCLDILL